MSRDRRGQSWLEWLEYFVLSHFYISRTILAACNYWKFPLRGRGGCWYIWGNLSLTHVSREYLVQGWGWFSSASCSQQLLCSGCLHPNWLCRRIAHCRASAVPHSTETSASRSDLELWFGQREEYQCFSASLHCALREPQCNSSQLSLLQQPCVCTLGNIPYGYFSAKKPPKPVIMSKGNNFQTSFSWCVLWA